MTEFDAFRARLVARFPNKVDDTVRFTADGKYNRDNYLILTGQRRVESAERQGRSQPGNHIWFFKVRAVGVSAEAVRGMLRDASLELVGWVPQVAGRTCYAVRWTDGTAPEADHAVKPPLFFADDEYELRSHFSNSGS